MPGTTRNIAILLVLTAVCVAALASTADAKVGGNAAAAAAQKMSKGAQVRLNRMKAKMALRPRGTMAQKTRRQIRLGKRKMVRLMNRRLLRPSKRTQLMRAVSRREVGLGGSESERTRERFARDQTDWSQMPSPEMLDKKNGTVDGGGIGADDVTPEMLEEISGKKRSKKTRDRIRKETTPPKKKIPKRQRPD
jgi:hypothetical protein